MKIIPINVIPPNVPSARRALPNLGTYVDLESSRQNFQCDDSNNNKKEFQFSNKY